MGEGLRFFSVTQKIQWRRLFSEGGYQRPPKVPTALPGLLLLVSGPTQRPGPLLAALPTEDLEAALAARSKAPLPASRENGGPHWGGVSKGGMSGTPFVSSNLMPLFLQMSF